MLLLLFIWTARRVLRKVNGSTVELNVPHLTRTDSVWAAAALGFLAVCCGGSEAIAEEKEFCSDDVAAAPAFRVAEVRSDSHQAGTKPHLREGTLVAATVGRIVMMGRRWAFVSAADRNPPDADMAARLTPLPTVDHKPRPKRLGLASLPSHTPIRFRSIAMRDDHEQEKASLVPARHMLIAENLMLQRIVEAIRADGADNLWNVTGEVTEFFNENRLLIRTAQRAGAK